MQNNKAHLQVAVIGLGKMGLLHASLLSVLPNVKLVGICDKARLMRAMAKRTLKEILITDTLDAFSDLNLDAVYVTTPIPSHYNIIKEVFSKNIARNVFVEKTLSSCY
jgi:predicted dehydrogenase